MKRLVRLYVAGAVAVAGFALAAIPENALAISRYESRSMSCAGIRATIRAEGAAIFRWRSQRSPSVPLFGRFVANGSYCMAHQIAEIRYIPAADTGSCGVYECRTDNTEDDLFELLFPRRRR